MTVFTPQQCEQMGESIEVFDEKYQQWFPAIRAFWLDQQGNKQFDCHYLLQPSMRIACFSQWKSGPEMMRLG